LSYELYLTDKKTDRITDIQTGKIRKSPYKTAA